MKIPIEILGWKLMALVLLYLVVVIIINKFPNTKKSPLEVKVLSLIINGY